MRRALSAAALLLACACVQAGDAVILDRVLLKDKGPSECWVVSETLEEMKWRGSPTAGTDSTRKRREIREVVYAFQRQPGAWTQGMEARDRGRFAESAELFAALAGGEREAEKVVGSFEEGASWDLAGPANAAAAAAAFGKIVAGFPAHPLALDARYRQGMVLAMAKKTDEADALAKKLEEDGKGKLGQAANVRAAAIRSAMALAKGDANELRRNVSKASFSPEAERGPWLHFNLFVADTLRSTGQAKDAVPIYERMLPQLAADPAASARVRLGIGVCKADSDRQGAIIDLLALDALPFGSPEQKCEARWHLGRLLIADADALEKTSGFAADERKVALAKENRAAALLLLQAAAEAVTDHPTKAQAAELLKTLAPAADEAKPGDKPAEAKPADKPADKPKK